jgi:uncharacterized membrane protein
MRGTLDSVWSRTKQTPTRVGIRASTMKLNLAVSACLLSLMAPAGAQTAVVQKEFKAKSGKDLRIGVFANVRPDCTSGPLPTIRLVKSPENGKITVRKARVNATNVKQCLSLTVPALVVFYRAASEFQGGDSAVLEIKSFEGKAQEQRYTIQVHKDGDSKGGI